LYDFLIGLHFKHVACSNSKLSEVKLVRQQNSEIFGNLL